MNPTPSEKVLIIIAEHFGKPIATLKPTDNLIDTYGADNLDGVELAIALEAELGKRFTTPYANPRTVQDLIDWANRK